MSDRSSWEKLRPWPVYLMALSLPMSLAAVNIFKAIMFVTALGILVGALARRQRFAQLKAFVTPAVVVAMLAVLAFSLTYTTAPMSSALVDFGKYGKLLVIPLVLVMVRTRREAMIALALFIAGETFILFTSYLLSMDLTLPWVPKTKAMRMSIGTVSSSYLDQSIMTTGLAVLCWHLRDQFPGRHGSKLAIAIVLLCAVNVLFLLPGRSGHVALLAALALALFWAGRSGPVALLVPLALVGVAMALSPDLRDRLSAVVLESRAYTQGDGALTSSGLRLNFWQRSIEAVVEHPLTGYGVGSWNTEFARLGGTYLNPHLANLRNPHQEYLLWAVQLGLGGVLLLLGFMVALVRDSMRFAPGTRHALQSLVAIFALVCLFNSSLFDALIGDFFCLLPGLLLALGLYSTAPGEPTP